MTIFININRVICFISRQCNLLLLEACWDFQCRALMENQLIQNIQSPYINTGILQKHSKTTLNTQSHHSEKLILYYSRVVTSNLKIANVAVIQRRLAVWKCSIIAHSHKDTVNHLRPHTTLSICFHSQRLCELLQKDHCVDTNTYTHAEKHDRERESEESSERDTKLPICMELKCLLLNNACSHLIFRNSTMQSASILSENSLRDANTHTHTLPA